MADSKITALSAAATLDGTELLAGVQSSGNVKILVSAISTFVGTHNLSIFAATTSLQLKGVISDETGSGSLVFATSPVLVTPNLGTPSAGTLTNTTGFPVANLSGAASGILTFLATSSSANLLSAVTDGTGTGSLVFANTPTLVTPVLGAAVATTLSIGGAALGGNVLATTGGAAFAGQVTAAILVVNNSTVPSNGMYLPSANTVGISANTTLVMTFAQNNISVASGKGFRVGNAAVTGLTAGVLAATTNATIVISDSAGQAYRIPCII